MAVQTPSLNTFCLKRRERLRVKNLRTEERKFHRLFISHIVNNNSIFYNARICREHAVNVSPEFNALYAERCAENGSRKIRAVPPQKSHNSVLVTAGTSPGTHKAREQKNTSLSVCFSVTVRKARVGASSVVRFTLFLTSGGKNKLPRIKKKNALTFSAEYILHNRGRKQFAHSHNAAVNSIRTFTE